MSRKDVLHNKVKNACIKTSSLGACHIKTMPLQQCQVIRPQVIETNNVLTTDIVCHSFTNCTIFNMKLMSIKKHQQAIDVYNVTS